MEAQSCGSLATTLYNGMLTSTIQLVSLSATYTAQGQECGTHIFMH